MMIELFDWGPVCWVVEPVCAGVLRSVCGLEGSGSLIRNSVGPVGCLGCCCWTSL